MVNPLESVYFAGLPHYKRFSVILREGAGRGSKTLFLWEPTEKPNTFFSKDKNQTEKFPLSDFFSRLQSTLGDISFYFFLFSFIRVVIRFKFVTNITQAPCIFVS